jgi:hypothetical protein
MPIMWSSHGMQARPAGCLELEPARKSYDDTVLYLRMLTSRHYAQPSRKSLQKKVTNWIQRVWFTDKHSVPFDQENPSLSEARNRTVSGGWLAKYPRLHSLTGTRRFLILAIPKTPRNSGRTPPTESRVRRIVRCPIGAALSE